MTEVHKACGKKYFVDFDIDLKDNPGLTEMGIFNKLHEYFYANYGVTHFPSSDPFVTIATRGGFHVLINIELANPVKTWYQDIKKMFVVDGRGDPSFPIPVPG